MAIRTGKSPPGRIANHSFALLETTDNRGSKLTNFAPCSCAVKSLIHRFLQLQFLHKDYDQKERIYLEFARSIFKSPPIITDAAMAFARRTS